MNIAVETLSDWSKIHSYPLETWMYRGQLCTSSLKTSIERVFERNQILAKRRDFVESELIRDFKRIYHQYGAHIPSDKSPVEWLSIMQHHGAPTRLLDFTYSIYVAAYFALERAEKECAIWAINTQWAMDQSIKLLNRAGKKNPEKLDFNTSPKHESITKHCLFAKPFVKCVTPMNAYRLNERLRIQKGVFLIPGDIEVSFMRNLQALSGHDSNKNVRKIIIPIEMRAEALKRLFYMNITRTSLFPGLDGYAQSLGIYHKIFKESVTKQ